MAKSLWHPGTKTPLVDWEYPCKEDTYVSERVVVEWCWENAVNGTLPTELRFARFFWHKNYKYWSIDGITGKAVVKRWFNPKAIK